MHVLFLKCKLLEQKLEQGLVFTEYEQMPKKWPNSKCSIAELPENAERNRFHDVLPYDDTRVELVPTKENNTGYINASHVKVCDSHLYTKNLSDSETLRAALRCSCNCHTCNGGFRFQMYSQPHTSLKCFIKLLFIRRTCLHCVIFMSLPAYNRGTGVELYCSSGSPN